MGTTATMGGIIRSDNIQKSTCLLPANLNRVYVYESEHAINSVKSDALTPMRRLFKSFREKPLSIKTLL